jgi:hypothetical protein
MLNCYVTDTSPLKTLIGADTIIRYPEILDAKVPKHKHRANSISIDKKQRLINKYKK